MKKRFLKILQNSLDNTCAGDLFKKELQVSSLITIYWNNFLKYQRLILPYYIFSSENIKTENGSF